MPDPAEEFGRLLRAGQAERRLPSVSAAVFRGGDVEWAEAVGLADVEEERETTPGTQYMIGSITKTFTAAAVMQLRDAGELSLDDPIGDYLEELPHRTPTLRRMLAHVSGLQRELPGNTWESLEFPDRETLMAGLGEVEQVLQPGDRWHYSNLAYVLLGEVVERRSGIPYERYVEERLLRPLGLERTTWRRAEPAATGYYVHPFSDTAKREPAVDKRGTAAAGALWSTPSDLCRWAAFLADPDPAVLEPKTVEEMYAPQVMWDPDKWSLGWGLGLMLFRREGGILAGHDGATVGFFAYMAFSREAKVGSALLMNSGMPDPGTFTALTLTEKALETWPKEPDPWAPGEPVPPELEPVLGIWWSEGAQHVFRFRNGKLEASLTNAAREMPPSVFEQEGPDLYRTVAGREQGEPLRIVRDEQGEVVKLYWATYPFLRTPTTFAAD